MMNKLLTLSTSLLATVAALPSPNPDSSARNAYPPQQTWYKLDQLARFENSVGLPAVAASPIGIYLDIFWQGMSLVQANLASVSGVVANTPFNYAGYSALDLVTVAQGQPSMTTNYQDSTIDHLDLKSFYYGCALGLEVSTLGVPTPCTVSIKGYADDQATNLVAAQSFGYTPSTGLSSPMFKATVSNRFRGLKRVDFFVSNDLLTAGLIDTVSYIVYSATKFY